MRYPRSKLKRHFVTHHNLLSRPYITARHTMPGGSAVTLRELCVSTDVAAAVPASLVLPCILVLIAVLFCRTSVSVLFYLLMLDS